MIKELDRIIAKQPPGMATLTKAVLAKCGRAGVKALMAAAREAADPPLNPKAKRRVIIRQSL